MGEGGGHTALRGCLTVLDTQPKTVDRVRDLLIAIFNRNGKEFKEKVLSQLMDGVKKSLEDLLSVAECGQGGGVGEGSESARAVVRIHLFTLLFEDCSRLCAELVESSGAMKLMVQLIDVALEVLQEAPGIARDTPKWITPMLLFIEMYQEMMMTQKTIQNNFAKSKLNQIFCFFRILMEYLIVGTPSQCNTYPGLSASQSAVDSGMETHPMHLSVVVEAHRRTEMERLRKKFGEYGEPYRVREYKEFKMYFENGDPSMFWLHADTRPLNVLQRYIQVSNDSYHDDSHMFECSCRKLSRRSL